MLECVGEVFTIKSDSLEIVTSDAERQFSPTRKTEVVLITPSGPVQTAPQGNKPVSKLKLKLGKESEKFSPFIERRHGNKVLSTTEEEVRVVRRQHDLTSFRWLRAERRSGFPPTSDARFINPWFKYGCRSGFPPTSDTKFTTCCEGKYVCGG